MNSYREYKRRRGRDFANLFQYNRLTLLAGGKLYQKPKEPKEQQKEYLILQGRGSASWILFLLRPKHMAMAKSNT